jgi:hypothetical protein
VTPTDTATSTSTADEEPKPEPLSKDDPAAWSIYVANDDCPDYTWGLSEAATRQAYADIIKAHLDEMTRTDNEPSASRDRYNAAVTNEVLAFVEKYPARKDELVRRIKEGRLFVSPYLCNSLWGFQSTECAIRTFYPARRLESAWGIPPATVAEHIELPSLPWGTASILAGCGIRWLSIPFYNYDSTFNRLNTPPLFILEGPDGSYVRVVMDAWTSNRFSYTQGAQVLRDPSSIQRDWLPHYRMLGQSYGPASILASGTHGDIGPASGNAAQGFAESIIKYNASAGPHPKLVNATLPMFAASVDEAEQTKRFLPIRRGDFGHSWDVWPVSLAQYAADMRSGERQFLAAEALLATAGPQPSGEAAFTAASRERAEWCWSMLSDHAWNGTDEPNQRVNANLRKKWSGELNSIGKDLVARGWQAAGLEADDKSLTLFNPTSVPRAADVVRCEAPAGMSGAFQGDNLVAQTVEEDGKRFLYLAGPSVPGLGTVTLMNIAANLKEYPGGRWGVSATPTGLESPKYRLAVDPKTGGIASLVLKSSGTGPGTELVFAKSGRTLCQTVYLRGREEQARDVKSEVVAVGPVLARLKITSTVGDVAVTNFVTVYAALDRVDFDVRIKKPTATVEERLLQFFPINGDGALLRADTTGAVIRPEPRARGDFLPGADERRLAVQGFIDASRPDGPGVTVVPVDAFCLRMDQDAPAFEAIGNDQNYKEVLKDQNGVTDFRFRYSLRGHFGPYKPAETVAWSRAAASPIEVAAGRMKAGAQPPVEVDPARAVALCFKPAMDEKAGGVILRVWETSQRDGPMAIKVAGFTRAVRTDLLERDLEELNIKDGAVTVDLKGNGFAALRLLP